MDIKRRLLLPFLSVLLILGIPLQTEAAGKFVDTGNTEFEQHVDFIAGKGIISGYEENGKSLFKPNEPVTRFQAAKMLVIATGNENMDASEFTFPDLKSDEAKKYVGIAAKLGFFSGYSDGTFKPMRTLKRGQMIKVLANAFNVEEPITIEKPLMFSDVETGYENATKLNGLYYNGIAQGSQGEFRTGSELSRAQFSMFLARAMDQKFRLKVAPVNNTVIANARVHNNLGSALNIRNSPTTSGKVIGKLNPGSLVAILKNDNLKTSEWVQVRYEKGPAYINASSAYVAMLDADNQDIGSATHAVKVNTKSASDPVLNVRSKPSVDGVVIGQLKNGEVIDVYGAKNGWHLVIFNGLPAYIQSAYTEKVEAPPAPKPPAAPGGNLVGKVTVNSLNVRQGPSDSTASLGKLNKGAQVTVKKLNGWWAQIDYNGKTAYVHKSFLKLKNTSGSILQNRIIVVDAGHGGSDPGTSKNGVTEKSITLKVSKLVEQKLKAAGATVYMTRSGDSFPSLQDRVDYAAQKYAEDFVSIHVNAAGSTAAKGSEVFFDTSINMNGAESSYLAYDIQQRLVKDVGMHNRGTFDKRFYVIRNQHIPAVLVELGFITNPQDYSKLTSNAYLERYAQAVYNGIVDYYNR
ncbi:N-acetylmuramoyl-L-alanine amidase [Bhargavaea cecembensis]|uniref:N-acetylmuramoyl-L-alanine amidase n=1 Tax=Bhargavaea cecembensis TaxID=394098 RepID=UPI00058CCEAC|nr:N-acetylmuramoyl-L-alanine amidase [Bhargavaea cecembensis]